VGAGGGDVLCFQTNPNVDAYKLIPDWFGLCIVGLEKQRKDDRKKERTKERNKEIIYIYIYIYYTIITMYYKTKYAFYRI